MIIAGICSSVFAIEYMSELYMPALSRVTKPCLFVYLVLRRQDIGASESGLFSSISRKRATVIINGMINSIAMHHNSRTRERERYVRVRVCCIQ